MTFFVTKTANNIYLNAWKNTFKFSSGYTKRITTLQSQRPADLLRSGGKSLNIPEDTHLSLLVVEVSTILSECDVKKKKKNNGMYIS